MRKTKQNSKYMHFGNHSITKRKKNMLDVFFPLAESNQWYMLLVQGQRRPNKWHFSTEIIVIDGNVGCHNDNLCAACDDKAGFLTTLSFHCITSHSMMLLY